MGPEELFTEENFDIFFNAEMDKHNKSNNTAGQKNKKANIAGAADLPVFDPTIFRRADGGEGDVSTSSSSSSSSSAAGGGFVRGFSLLPYDDDDSDPEPNPNLTITLTLTTAAAAATYNRYCYCYDSCHSA